MLQPPSSSGLNEGQTFGLSVSCVPSTDGFSVAGAASNLLRHHVRPSFKPEDDAINGYVSPDDT